MIGLAVPGRPIGPWSRRTGAPQASATRRDQSTNRPGLGHTGATGERLTPDNYGLSRLTDLPHALALAA